MFGAYAPLPLRLTGNPDGWSAQQHARAAADLLAVVQTAAFAYIHVNTSGSGSVVSYLAQHGTDRPTLTRHGTGDITITWEGAYSTDFERGATNILAPTVQSYTEQRAVAVELVSPRAARVRITAHPAGTAADGAFGLWVL